jgi:hypothetical protein
VGHPHGFWGVLHGTQTRSVVLAGTQRLVTILDGQRHPLGDHPADLSPPQKRKGKWVVPSSIEKKVHSLLSAPATQPNSAIPSAGLSVSELLDKFLDWTLKYKASRTFEWYRDHLQSFQNHLAAVPIAAGDLRPFHVIEWIDKHPNWSSAYRRGAIVAVQRPFQLGRRAGSHPREPDQEAAAAASRPTSLRKASPN